MKEEGADPPAEHLLSSQRAYYDLRAPDYASVTAPADRRTRSLLPAEVAAALIDELQPSGDALEFACGPGMFTRELARHTRSVTAVDASVHMLARSRSEVADSKVRNIQGDVFTWAPDRVYDTVFFGLWLSHVPPAMFEQFWSLVRDCLSADGRVAFVDEDDRASGHDDLRIVDGTPVATRTLSDGRSYDIVKVFWEPRELAERLRGIGWDITVEPVGETYLVGHGHDVR